MTEISEEKRYCRNVVALFWWNHKLDEFPSRDIVRFIEGTLDDSHEVRKMYGIAELLEIGRNLAVTAERERIADALESILDRFMQGGR